VMCECGHHKSQHPNKKCDYAGYACSCEGYKKSKKAVAASVPKDLLPSTEIPLYTLSDLLNSIKGSKKAVIVGISKSTFPMVKP